MKKFIYFIIISLIFLNNAAFATGVLTPPQSVKKIQPLPPNIKSIQEAPKVQRQSFPTVTVEKPFNPTVEPIRKLEESGKALQAATEAEVSVYNKISLPDAIKYAMAHNLDIVGNRLNVDMAKNDIKKANQLKNPYVQSYVNMGKAAEDNPNYFGLIFPFEIAKRGVRKKLAKSALELTKGNVLLAELNLRLDVRQAYVDLVAAKSTLKILNDQRQLVQELLSIAQKKYDAGAVPQMDVVQAKMTLNQLLIQVNSAKTDVLVARYKFNLILGSTLYDSKEDYLPEQKDFIGLLTPKPTAKLPSYEEIYKIALAKRIDIQNAQKDIDVAEKNYKVVIRQRVPDVEIGGGYIFVPSALATAERLTQGAYAAANITNIPLLYQYSPEIKNAKIQIEQKQLAYDKVKHQALLNVHSAYDSFNTAQMNLNYYNDLLLQESNQFLFMARKSYVVGKTSINDFIYIEQSYKNIMMGYVNSLAQYYNAWVDVLREVNDEDLKLNG